MVGWHQQLDGHKFEQTLGVGNGQGNLTCCRPRVAELDVTEQLKSTELPPDPDYYYMAEAF